MVRHRKRLFCSTLMALVFIFTTCFLQVGDVSAEQPFQESTPDQHSIRAAVDYSPPVITLWYGDSNHNQIFGTPGISQRWLNILGNVSDPESKISSLSYKLNKGNSVALNIGPDDRRLYYPGDFNIDLDQSAASLVNGTNTVTITAINSAGLAATAQVTVLYNNNQVWPQSYGIDWASVTSDTLQKNVQIVDGKWALTPDGLRIQEIGYDRIIAIGDITWQDYEITVPITIHSIDQSIIGVSPSTGPGLGINLRWTGHSDDPVNCGQPHCGWLPVGASNWVSWDLVNSTLVSKIKIAIDPINNGPNPVIYTPQINAGVTYWFKARVVTNSFGYLYQLKVWGDGSIEPTGWLLEKQTVINSYPSPDYPAQGSLILVAHHVDATIGDISVFPADVTTYTITTGSVSGEIPGTEGGTVSRYPDQSSYASGSSVTFTANPAPGWKFNSWGGDLSGSASQQSLKITRSIQAIAYFKKTSGTPDPIYIFIPSVTK